MSKISFLPCPCCGVNLALPYGFVQNMVMEVSVAVNIPWEKCPDCGYKLDGFRFHTPKFQGKPKIGGSGGQPKIRLK